MSISAFALLVFAALHTLAQPANPDTFLDTTIAELQKDWPANRTVNLVFHGHSVPAGYFKTPVVDSLEAYPHLVRAGLAQRFPHAVINVIVSAIGGENSQKGAARFQSDVLDHRPDVLFIDYSLNDRGLGLDRAAEAWKQMIQQAQSRGIKVILLTPTPDLKSDLGNAEDPLEQQAAQVRRLAAEFNTGLIDSLELFRKARDKEHMDELMSQRNHPNALGHALVANSILTYFQPRP
ncbi:MAG: SGNH/GDSL hydrolase family protein [Acidobacteria bacterium]|nr:SGNH/GDSL hydrolase family protein [Acidobacteriota bacterium]